MPVLAARSDSRLKDWTTPPPGAGRSPRSIKDSSKNNNNNSGGKTRGRHDTQQGGGKVNKKNQWSQCRARTGATTSAHTHNFLLTYTDPHKSHPLAQPAHFTQAQHT